MPLVGFGRLSQPGLLVLLSLVDGAKHGYAISEDIEALTGRRPGPGTLYGAIGRLEERGLIERRGAEGRRQPYQLTATGLGAVRDEITQLTALATAAQSRLAVRGALG